jgi:hypothetical protein
MEDKLKWIDEALAQERKDNPIPNELQVSLAGALENDWGGDWNILGTCTFRPNEYEEIVQRKNGEFYQNEKVSWLTGERIVKRVGRSGEMRFGTPGISPGWSPDAAERMIHRWIQKDPGLRDTRWFLAVEAHKHRNCHHGHVLFANSGKVNWIRARDKWEDKFGRFRLEKVKDDQGMAMYLAKRYVGKEYGSDKFRMSVSRNARRPKKDPCSRLGYEYLMMLYKNDCLGKDASKMMSWQRFQRSLGLKL